MREENKERESGLYRPSSPWPMDRRSFLQGVGAMPLLGFAPTQVAVTPAKDSTPLYKSVNEVIRQPWGKFFWIERRSGTYRFGDSASHFCAVQDFTHLTFDIGNNKALANVGVQGSIKKVTLYRDSYFGDCFLPGVWTGKDITCFGPYSYTVEIGGRVLDLATLDWDFRTGLLGNMFPITEMPDPDGQFMVRLLTYAPLVADGSQRLRGIVYGLHLENTSENPLQGTVHLPKIFADNRNHPKGFMAQDLSQSDPCEFEIALGGTENSFQREVSFDLIKGESVWVPTVLCAPGDPTVREFNERGSVEWLLESWQYYRRMMGQLELPGDEYVQEFHQRQMMTELQSIGMSGSGKLVGTNWGSYPATRLVWNRDAYYTCLPIGMKDPQLARKTILWFTEFGVRPKSAVMPGGVNHSLGSSLSSVVLGGRYYEQTGDKTFFLQHPELATNWEALLKEVVASRVDEDVWLFPTQHISDGDVKCDYHTGSNVVAWRALKDYGRILEEVYGQRQRGREYAQMADRVRAAIMEKTVIDGPFGKQFIEGVNRDGSVPKMMSDGEESDTTLMPFYGFLAYDNEIYLNYMRFSMSKYNSSYNERAWAIMWYDAPATIAGYIKGIAYGLDRSALWDEHGYYSEVRKVTDADGSLWWWPYTGMGLNSPWNYEKPVRYSCGKSGWFAGVHSAVFMSRFLGVSYDAPTRVFRFAPFLPSSDQFSWEDFPMGNDRFSLSYEKTAGAVRATLKNLNQHQVHLDAVLPVDGLGNSLRGSVNGHLVESVALTRYLRREAVHVSAKVAPSAAVDLTVKRSS